MITLTSNEIAIRGALDDAVQSAGGPKYMAAALKCDTDRISRMLSIRKEFHPHEIRYLRASEIPTVDLLAGNPIILSKVCNLSSRPLPIVVEPRVAAEGEASHLCELTKEISEAFAALSDAMRAPSPSINHRRRIIRELQDVIDRAHDAIAESERLIADDGKTSLKAV